MAPIVITFTVLAAAVVLLLADWLRSDLVALLVLISLGLTGVLTPQEAFSGFSRSAVITILAIFILAEGLRRTGVTDTVGRLLLRVAGPGEGRLAVIVLLAGAFLSLFMNNIAAASILMPAVSGAARASKASLPRLLMPLAFGTILGGMATLFTTTNIVVSSLLRDEGLPGYGVLDFAPLGLPLIAVGASYMALLGRRWLPEKTPAEQLDEPGPGGDELARLYRLDERLVRASVTPGSQLIGKSLGESELRERYHLNLVAIQRMTKMISFPPPEYTFQPNDIVWLEARPEELSADSLAPVLTVLPQQDWKAQALESDQVALVEAVLAPRSGLIGQTLRDVHFREKYGMGVIAIWRGSRPIRTRLSELPLQLGDALLLLGPRQRLPALHSDSDLIILNGGEGRAPANPRMAGLAIVIMAVTLALAAFGLFPIGEVMLGGAIAMVLAGILTMDQAYQSVEWKGIVLIAGMLPLGIAMSKTGAAAALSERLIAVIGPGGPVALLSGLVLATILMSQVMNGAAVAAIVAPIAIGVAQQMGLEPRSLAMGVALATSMTFLTPLGHPVNVLVMSPGGYRFRDYFKVGGLLTLLCFGVLILLLPVVWPLK